MKRPLSSMPAGVLVLVALLTLGAPTLAQTDSLPSWNDGPARKAIVEFVQTTTTQGSPKFVPPAERIATFDQDGTLWVEQPLYSQVIYCLDRVPAVVKAKPELANVEPFKTVMSGNHEAIAKLPEADLFKILAATLTGMSVDEFRAEAKKWLATAKDSRWKRPYTERTRRIHVRGIRSRRCSTRYLNDKSRSHVEPAFARRQAANIRGAQRARVGQNASR